MDKSDYGLKRIQKASSKLRSENSRRAFWIIYHSQYESSKTFSSAVNQKNRHS